MTAHDRAKFLDLIAKWRTEGAYELSKWPKGWRHDSKSGRAGTVIDALRHATELEAVLDAMAAPAADNFPALVETFWRGPDR